MYFNINILEEISIFLNRDQKDLLSPININLKEFYQENVKRSIYSHISPNYCEIYEYIDMILFNDLTNYYIKDGKFVNLSNNYFIGEFIIAKICYYLSGGLHGLYTSFYLDKNNVRIREQTMYLNDEKYGEHKVYWENGNLKIRIHYAGEEPYNEVHMDWIKDGEYEEYYEHGEIKTKGFYKNNKPIGIFTYYDICGNKNEIDYDKNNKIF